MSEAIRVEFAEQGPSRHAIRHGSFPIESVNLFKTVLKAQLEALKFDADEAQLEPWLESMWQHFALVCEANRHFNLTRITAPGSAAILHYADSLAVLPCMADRKWEVTSVLDIGTGAGFPAIPVAICRPSLNFVAIDGTGKKVDFLERARASIGLENLHVGHERSEHWRPKEPFDLILARAFGPLEKIMRQASHLLAPGGRIVAYKSATSSLEEMVAARPMAQKKGLAFERDWEYRLDVAREEGTSEPYMRKLILIRKD